MEKDDLKYDAPWYAWDCISLSIKNKWDVYLLIKNEKVMSDFIKLLIYKTESLDGYRDTAILFKKRHIKRLHKKSDKELTDQ